MIQLLPPPHDPMGQVILALFVVFLIVTAVLRGKVDSTKSTAETDNSIDF